MHNDILEVSKSLHELGLLFLGNHANISERIKNRILITKSGNMKNLTLTDLAYIDENGKSTDIFEATYREIIGLHDSIYKARDDINAIIHCHPPYLTSFAVAHVELSIVNESLPRLGICRPVPVVPWGKRGSQELEDNIVEIMRSSESSALLLANHGVIVTGKDLYHARDSLIAMEETAELIILAQTIGGAVKL